MHCALKGIATSAARKSIIVHWVNAARWHCEKNSSGSVLIRLVSIPLATAKTGPQIQVTMKPPGEKTGVASSFYCHRRSSLVLLDALCPAPAALLNETQNSSMALEYPLSGEPLLRCKRLSLSLGRGLG